MVVVFVCVFKQSDKELDKPHLKLGYPLPVKRLS